MCCTKVPCNPEKRLIQGSNPTHIYLYTHSTPSGSTYALTGMEQEEVKLGANFLTSSRNIADHRDGQRWGKQRRSMRSDNRASPPLAFVKPSGVTTAHQFRVRQKRSFCPLARRSPLPVTTPTIHEYLAPPKEILGRKPLMPQVSADLRQSDTRGSGTVYPSSYVHVNVTTPRSCTRDGNKDSETQSGPCKVEKLAGLIARVKTRNIYFLKKLPSQC